MDITYPSGWRHGVGGLGQGGSSAADVARDDRTAEALAVAAARRDPVAFAPLYRAYFDAVYRYCLRSLGDADAAADATREVFAKALAAIARSDIAEFRPWLFTIAHNVIVDRRRQHTRRPPPLPLLDASDRPDPAPSPEETALAAEARRTVHHFLARLSDDQRAVVELRLADLTAAEAAAILGRSVGSVKIAQHRAFRRLRDLMLAAEAGGDRHDTR
jgi:RNA polymerase sigma-70 factor (ECF subfamily)